MGRFRNPRPRRGGPEIKTLAGHLRDAIDDLEQARRRCAEKLWPDAAPGPGLTGDEARQARILLADATSRVRLLCDAVDELTADSELRISE